MNQAQNSTGPRALTAFSDYLRIELSLSDNTIGSYSFQINGFLAFVLARGGTLATADSSLIRKFLKEKSDAGCRSSSRFMTTMALKKFFAFLKMQNVRQDNPSVDISLPKCQQQIPDPLSVSEIEALILKSSGTRFSLTRMKAMLEILYSTGMRISELIGLNLGDVDLDNGWVRVLGKGKKTRDVPFGPKAAGALRQYLTVRNIRNSDPSNRFLFLNAKGSRLTRGGFWKQLRALAKHAQITEPVFPHRLRHTTACHLLAKGMDIRILQELLGHASITTTQRYTRVAPELLKMKVEAFHPHF
jgi:integrase/recombinase XerD